MHTVAPATPPNSSQSAVIATRRNKWSWTPGSFFFVMQTKHASSRLWALAMTHQEDLERLVPIPQEHQQQHHQQQQNEWFLALSCLETGSSEIREPCQVQHLASKIQFWRFSRLRHDVQMTWNIVPKTSNCWVIAELLLFLVTIHIERDVFRVFNRFLAVQSVTNHFSHFVLDLKCSCDIIWYAWSFGTSFQGS